MAMRWDPVLASALARELHETLRGRRVLAFHLDAESRQVHLFMRDATLVLECHPTAGWVSLAASAEPFSGAQRLPARIVDVRAPPDESAMIVGLQRVRGRDEGLELVVEWIGNRWNAAFVGHRTGVIRHVLVSRDERERSLAVGAPYSLPPETGRRGKDGDLEREEWANVLAEAGDDPGARRKAILRSVAWTSSLNVSLFLGEDGWEAWRAAVDPENWSARLLELPKGPQPYPLEVPPHRAEEADSLVEAMRVARKRTTDGPERLILLPPGLLDEAERRLHAAKGRVHGMRRELERARDPDPVRRVGDLILARYGEVPEGASTVTLTDFQGDPVEVELDPALSPARNAERYYDEAARLERARRELPAKIERAEKAARRWKELVTRLREGTVSAEEAESVIGPARGSPGRKRAGSEPSRPYRRFRSSGGLEIRVGRGASRNDDLTFHHSRPDDVWLHVREAPGAHVILRWDSEGNPPRRDLVEAAVLAAVHSEARHSSSVPVDWTRRKYVRKPRKAPPGAVRPERVETLFVKPDPRLPERLAEADGA